MKKFPFGVKSYSSTTLTMHRDARSRVVCLTPEMLERLDEFFDQAVGELRRSHKILQSKGPLPEEP